MAELRSKLNSDSKFFSFYTPHASTLILTCWFDPEERTTSCLNALKRIPGSECLGNQTLKWLIVRQKWGKLTKCTCLILFEDLPNQNLQGWDPETLFFHHHPLVFGMTIRVEELLDQMMGKLSPKDKSLRIMRCLLPV